MLAFALGVWRMELTTEHFVAARATLCRELAARRAERFGREIKGPAFDDDVMVIGYPDDPPAPPVMFHLIYHDAKGAYSGRVVTVQSVRAEVGEIRLGTICHWRGKYRGFLASRVVEVTDLATGEVHEDGLGYFGAHPLLQGLTANSITNLSLETLAMQTCRDEVIVLSFIAAADGMFDEAERDAIVLHVMNRCPDEGLSEAEVRRRVRAFVPDERAFEMALGRLCRGEGDARALMRSMRRVMDADGELDPEEVAFVMDVERRLREAGRL